MQPFTRVSEDDYLAAERTADTKHELVNGHVVAMAGDSIRHNALVARLLMSLGTRLRGAADVRDGEPDQPRIERYERGEHGTWTLHEALGGESVLELPALAIALPLSELYDALPE